MEAHAPDFQPAKDEPLIYPLNKLLTDIPFEAYVKAPGMNASSLKEFYRSPAHYYEYRYNHVEKEDTDSLLKGRLLHMTTLEPDRFREFCVVEPIFEGRTAKGELTTSANCKEVKEKKAEWYAKLRKDAIVVPADFVDDLIMMTNKLLKHIRGAKLFKNALREVSMWWIDEETGELCKGRFDLISYFIDRYGKNRIWCADLKSTVDARETAFIKQCENLFYHLSAAHYLEGGRISKTFESEAFVFLAVEKKRPFEIAVYPAGRMMLGIGEQWRSTLMKQYAECRKTWIYPGYNARAQTIELPNWARVPQEDTDGY